MPTKEQICIPTGWFTQECYKVLKKKMTVEGHPVEVVKHNKTFDIALIRLSGEVPEASFHREAGWRPGSGGTRSSAQVIRTGSGNLSILDTS